MSGWSLLVISLSLLFGGVLLGSTLLALTYTILTYSHWLKDRRSRGYIPEPAPSDDLLQIQWAGINEWISSTALFALHPLGAVEPRNPLPQPVERRRPILLIHGFAQARSNFWFLRPRLAAVGLGPFYSLNLRTKEGDLVHHSRVLSEFIDRVREATGAEQVDVVAHSMGGLVARLAESMGSQRRIRRLVTLGTPHRGTQMAYLAPGESAWDMRLDSQLLQSLPKPPRDLIVAISSSHDNVVVPPENARIGPLGRDLEVEGVGHLSLLTDAKVAMQVARALGEDIRRAADVMEKLSADDGRIAVQPRSVL